MENIIQEFEKILNHKHHHHRAPPSAPYLSNITIKETSMSITGVVLPIIDLTLTLPTTRNDGSALAVTEIQSATILRDPGTGAVTLTVLPGPFSGATAIFADVQPATGTDIYSFFVTDTNGKQGDTSLPVSVTVTGVPAAAPPSAGTLTAIARVGATAPVVPPSSTITPILSTTPVVPPSSTTPLPATNTGFPPSKPFPNA
jgi:hypothetical protein